MTLLIILGQLAMCGLVARYAYRFGQSRCPLSHEPPEPSPITLSSGPEYCIVTDLGVTHYKGRNGSDAIPIWDSVLLNPGANSWTLTVDGVVRGRRGAV